MTPEADRESSQSGSVELITIGDELLLGFTVDTNASFLGRHLAAVGLRVVRRTTVGDDIDSISGAVRAALERTGRVITSGGLGPTSDDVTHEGVARAIGVSLHTDSAVLRRLEERFARIAPGRVMPHSNRRQAMLPEGCEALRNSYGTAPGAWIRTPDGFLATLPGVPREMQGMFLDEVLPRLVDLLPGSGRRLLSRTLRTTGIAESALADRVLQAGADIPALAFLPGPLGVDMRITRTLDSDSSEQSMLHELARLRAVAADFCYGEDEDDLAAVVLSAARRRGLTIGVAESCTGGLLGERLTAVPGSSDVFLGGVIAYSNALKESLLGVDGALLRTAGAVSAEAAREMARGARARCGADAAVAITGIAGPGGGSDSKPVGLVYICAEAGQHGLLAREFLFPGDRSEIRQRAAQAALDILRRLLEVGAAGQS